MNPCDSQIASCGSSCFNNCSCTFEMDLSTPRDVWPGICSANSPHQLDTAPWILSCFAEWIERSKSSMFTDSVVKCVVFLPPFRLKILRLSALVPRNMGWRLSAKFLIIWSASLSHFPSGWWRVRSIPFFFTCKTEEWPMSSLKSFCVISHFFGIRNTVQWNFILCPINVFEHRHEYNSSLKLFWIYSSSLQIFLNLCENFKRWLSIDFRQLCVLVWLLKLSDLAFPLFIRFWMTVHLSQTQDRIWVDMHFSRPLNCLIMTQSRFHPRRRKCISSQIHSGYRMIVPRSISTLNRTTSWTARSWYSCMQASSLGIEARDELMISIVVDGVNIFDLDFGVQVDSVKQPVQRDSVGSGHVSHHWTSSFDDHLDHCLVVFKNVQMRFTLRRSCVVGHVIQIWLLLHSGYFSLNFALDMSKQFPAASLNPLLFPEASWVGGTSVDEGNTSITTSHKWRAGVPSILNPASSEIISDAVELWDIGVCFLHIQLMGRNVRLPKEQKILPDVEFESSKSPVKSEPWNRPNLQCWAVFPTWQHCL